VLATGLVATLLAALTLVATIGAASTAAGAREPVEVTLLGSGTLLDGGAGAEVRALVRCDPTPPVLEALVTASQDDNVGFSEGFFFSLTCDGRPHVQSAQLQTFDEERFRRGKAQVSAFVLLCDEESGECFTGQDTRLVQLR
jgi:hypothetical protein